MITEAQVAQLASQYGRGSRDPAFLDLAQEHLLHWLAMEMNAFNDGRLAFKGGTALRKFTFGKNGRFSTDLDFWTTDAGFAGTVIDLLGAGIEYHGVTLRRRGEKTFDGYELHANWMAEAPGLGETAEPSKIEFSVRPRLRPLVTPKGRPAIAGIDARMGFAPPVVPVYDVLETISEKLSRVRYKPLARDFYDLHLLGPTLTFDDLKVVRRLLAFKVAMDYFEGTRRIPIPFNGGADFVGLPPDRITGLDDIGRLAGRLPDPDEMCNKLTQFFGRPMGKPSGALEIRLAKVRPTDAWWVKSKLAEWDLGL